MNIYIDIETIPSQSEQVKKEIRDSITAPATYKKPESIAEWMASNLDAEADDKWRKTSFDGGLGQIVAIGMAVNSGKVETFWSDDWANDEASILHAFFETLTDSCSREIHGGNMSVKPVFIGHYITGFDLRFLFQRAVMLGIKPPSMIPFRAKPWDSSVFDTMTEWAGHGNRVSLYKLCKIFGIAGKGSEICDEIDGSRVWDFVRDGRIADVAKYCAGDVDRVREVHKRLTFAK